MMGFLLLAFVVSSIAQIVLYVQRVREVLSLRAKLAESNTALLVSQDARRLLTQSIDNLDERLRKVDLAEKAVQDSRVEFERYRTAITTPLLEEIDRRMQWKSNEQGAWRGYFPKIGGFWILCGREGFFVTNSGTSGFASAAGHIACESIEDGRRKAAEFVLSWLDDNGLMLSEIKPNMHHWTPGSVAIMEWRTSGFQQQQNGAVT